MKKSKSLLKILILLILAGSIVNAEYFKENGKIYYNLPYYEIKSEVKEADSESFEILKNDDENGELDDYYGKDKKNVYFLGKKLENVSSNGFEVLGMGYVKDDKNVYELTLTEHLLFSGDKVNTRKIEMPGLDAESFKNLGNIYYADKYNVYYFYGSFEKIKGADRNSFEIMGNSYIAKDKKNVYYQGNKLENVDSGSFKNFNDLIAKDKNRVFFIEENKKIKNVDVKSFEIIENSSYFRDKNNIFVWNEIDYDDNLKRLNDIDRESFTVLNSVIGKDKNGVYYVGEKILGINPDNAKIVEDLDSESYIFQSGNNYYLVFKKEEETDNKEKVGIKNINDLKIDFETFDYFGGLYYYKDKNNFYYFFENNLKKIKSDIDVKNAKEIGNLGSIFINFVIDNKNIYYLKDDNIRKINSDIDVNNLEVIKNDEWYIINYVKDKKNIYYLDDESGKVKKLKNVDYDTFKIINGKYGIDKNSVFLNGEKLDFISVDGFKILDNEYLKDSKNVYEIYETNDSKIKIRAIKNLNIDAKSFEKASREIFYRDKNSVYYVDISEEKSVLKKLEGADAKTFQAGILSKDKNNVYYDTEILKDVSPNGFKILNMMPLIMKDNKNVYYLDMNEDDKVTPIILNFKDMDIATFEAVENIYYSNLYYKDKNNIYSILKDFNEKIRLEKLNGANPKTFEIFDNYAKDDKNVYIYGNKLDGIEAKTFEALSDEIVKDKNGLYFLEADIENESFEIKVQKLKLDGIDLRSFGSVDGSDYYYKDKNSIYYKKNDSLSKIKNADVKTFETLSEYPGYYAKDKNNVYFKGINLEKIDSKSFEIMQNNFVKDKNGVYIIEENENDKNIKIISINEKIDFESFEKAEEGYNIDDGNYYKDKNNIYYVDENGFKKLEGADVNSFERIKFTYYYKDKNSIYINGKKLENFEAKYFEILDGEKFRYKTEIYYYDEESGTVKKEK